MSGRPRTACGTCQFQKIRCTGERPICKRCARLKHSCRYDGAEDRPRDFERARETGQSQLAALRHSTAIYAGGSSPGSYLGIPKPLIAELIENFYENVSNSFLVLHKTQFLESVHAGTAAPHILLSVCAWGANFYRDSHGSASLRTGGFMIEWAQQAGTLVFQEIEKFRPDVVVTLLNLTLFWHGQGSWKVSSLYKANAFHTLCINGIADPISQQETFEMEVQRRRFWSWYIMHCHTTESVGVLEPVGDILHLPLPWCDEDFNLGRLASPTATLASTEGSNSVFAELAKVMTIWSQAVNLIRTPEASLTSGRVAAIHALDERLSLWWRNLPTSLKLNTDPFTNVPCGDLPRILLINLVYHQTMCVLHASIVPLFCWNAGDDNWLSSRQFSAQIAYEHACTVSALIRAALASRAKVGAMPTFVSYAAYGCCAILIPFMWCTNLAIRSQAQASVRANIRIINGMAEYWKFAALLTVHVKCLYNIHKRSPPTLDNEPKYIDVCKLTNFRVEALYARVSILEFLGILQKGPSSFSEPGQETKDLGIKQSGGEPIAPRRTTDPHDMHVPAQVSHETFIPIDNTTQSAYSRNGLSGLMQSEQWNLLPPPGAGFDMFLPSPVVYNLEPISGNSAIDLIQSNSDHGFLGIDGGFLDIDGWSYEPMV